MAHVLVFVGSIRSRPLLNPLRLRNLACMAFVQSAWRQELVLPSTFPSPDGIPLYTIKITVAFTAFFVGSPFASGRIQALASLRPRKSIVRLLFNVCLTKDLRGRKIARAL
jgi:hypothetical protein